MPRRIRIGLLGFAHPHADFWSEVFRESPLGEFVGAWDHDAARGAAGAARHGVPLWPELDDLLDACEAVAITAETARHRALVEAAAGRGRHVLCEKPLATTREDCEAIARAVAASGIVFMQSFPKRFDPVNHELRRLVAEGELGRITLARVRHGHAYGFQPDFLRTWFTDPVLAGGGALLDEGVHGADFLRWLFGEPESVTATVSNATLGLAVDDVAVAVFRFPGGAVAELASSFTFAAADNSVELFGTRGTAVLSGVDLGSRDITHEGFLKVYRVGQPERRWTVSPLVPRFKQGGFHHQNAIHFLEALAQGTPPPITLDDGLRAVEMILAAYEAARTGRRQPVPSPGARRGPPWP